MISPPVRIPRRPAASPERRRLTSAQWSITLRISLVMSVIMLLVVAIVYSVVLFAQRADAERETQWGIRHNTVDSPPVCMWITVERDGVLRSTRRHPGRPAREVQPDRGPARALPRCWSG